MLAENVYCVMAYAIFKCSSKVNFQYLKETLEIRLAGGTFQLEMTMRSALETGRQKAQRSASHAGDNWAYQRGNLGDRQDQRWIG